MTGTETVRRGKTRPIVQLSAPRGWLCVKRLDLVLSAAACQASSSVGTISAWTWLPGVMECLTVGMDLMSLLSVLPV